MIFSLNSHPKSLIMPLISKCSPYTNFQNFSYSSQKSSFILIIPISSDMSLFFIKVFCFSSSNSPNPSSIL